jgi:hypothetical protein
MSVGLNWTIHCRKKDGALVFRAFNEEMGFDKGMYATNELTEQELVRVLLIEELDKVEKKISTILNLRLKWQGTSSFNGGVDETAVPWNEEDALEGLTEYIQKMRTDAASAVNEKAQTVLHKLCDLAGIKSFDEL